MALDQPENNMENIPEKHLIEQCIVEIGDWSKKDEIIAEAIRRGWKLGGADEQYHYIQFLWDKPEPRALGNLPMDFFK